MRAPPWPFWGFSAAPAAADTPLPRTSSARPRTAGAALRAYLFERLRGALTSLDVTRLAAGQRLEERARCREVVFRARQDLVRAAALAPPAERHILLFAADRIQAIETAMEGR